MSQTSRKRTWDRGTAITYVSVALIATGIVGEMVSDIWDSTTVPRSATNQAAVTKAPPEKLATDGFTTGNYIEVIKPGTVGYQKINGKDKEIPLPVGTILKTNYVGAFVLMADGDGSSLKELRINPNDVKDIGDKQPEHSK
jgi:uncharacterized protein YcfJ